MADYFTHFSCLLDVGTPQNAARALDLYNALSEAGAAEEPPSEGFLVSIQPEHGSSRLWLRDDVSGDPERLIQFVTDRPGHDARYAIDASKIRDELGWRPRHDFDAGLRDTVRWFLENRGWWERVMSGAYRGERLGLTG